jgi:hypothetical protein
MMAQEFIKEEHIYILYFIMRGMNSHESSDPTENYGIFHYLMKKILSIDIFHFPLPLLYSNTKILIKRLIEVINL